MGARRHDTGGDLTDQVCVVGGLGSGDAGRHHGRRRHVGVCAEEYDVAHVVVGPDVGDVVATVLDHAPEGRVGGLGVAFRRNGLEGRTQVLREEVEGRADALPLFEGGGGRRVKVGFRLSRFGRVVGR